MASAGGEEEEGGRAGAVSPLLPVNLRTECFGVDCYVSQPAATRLEQVTSCERLEGIQPPACADADCSCTSALGFTLAEDL